MTTYNNLYLDNRNALREAGSENPQLEARLLLSCAAGETVAELLAHNNLYATHEVIEKNKEYLNRCLRGEPVAYITGSWEFYGLPFYVNSHVLIPRMDTETVVDSACDILKNGPRNIRILDLCTGSGNIACTLAHGFPGSCVIAVDYSPYALEVCRKNASSLNLSSQVHTLRADALNRPPDGMGTFDMIISNPPYIPREELQDLDPSVRDYEPRIALDGGKDGLDFYRSILASWVPLLKEGGALVFEVGEDQAAPVKTLMEQSSFTDLSARTDTLGTERAVTGKKKIERI